MASQSKNWPQYLIGIILGSLATFLILGADWRGGQPQVEGKGIDASAPDLPDPFQAGWKGEKVCEVLEENENVRVLKCIFPPGVGHEQHYHRPHTGYTLAGGKFRIADSTEVREVNVPTWFVFGNDNLSVHEVLNIGETTSEYIIIEYKK